MAGVIMRSTDFRSEVAPILNDAFDGIYNQRTPEYKKFMAETDGIKRSYHEEPVLFGFQMAPQVPDGQATPYDNGGQLYVKRYPYLQYGLAFAMTQILIEDGEHLNMGKMYAEHLAQSMDETIETISANVLNFAFTSGYNMPGDGVSLVNTSHPVIGGVQSNQLNLSAALSQTSLEQALLQVRQVKDSRGKNIHIDPEKLLIHPSNMLQAEVLLNSVLRTGTNNNDLNPVKSMGVLKESVIISRLTSPTAWFIQAKKGQTRGLKILWRRRIKKTMEGDFETDSVRYKSTFRLGIGWTDWRDIPCATSGT